MKWQKVIGGDGSEGGNSVQQTKDDGYIVTGGITSSYDDIISDVILVKTDASGNVEWQKTFGGDDSEYGNSVQQTNDGGYIVAGYTNSYGAGGSDVYLVKTDAYGNVE